MRDFIAEIAVCVVLTGCYQREPEPGPPPTGAAVEVHADGVSDPFELEIPAGARSLTIEVVGEPDTLLALSSLVLSDGLDRVTLGAGSVPDRLREIYETWPLATTGELRQFVRRGTFTHLYPDTDLQPLPPGPATLRVAASAPGTVHVTVATPPDDGADVLHLNFIRVSESDDLGSPPPWLDEVQGVFDQAGLEIVVDGQYSMSPEGFTPVTPEGNPEPDDVAARLAVAGRQIVESNGIDVFVVDPFDAVGFSLAMPGPLDPSSYYSGVIVSASVAWPGDPDMVVGRIVAHELGHLLGLPHTEELTPWDELIPDPFDDTETYGRNLMGSVDISAPMGLEDLALSPRQVFRLERSALLAVD